MKWSEVSQSCPTLCDPMDTRLLRPWDFLSKSTGVGCHFLLQGIFPTQGSNPGLPHCRQTLYGLSHQGSSKYTLLRHFCLKYCAPFEHSWIFFPHTFIFSIPPFHVLPIYCLFDFRFVLDFSFSLGRIWSNQFCLIFQLFWRRIRLSLWLFRLG